MSKDIPESLTSCMDPSTMSLADRTSKAADLAAANGMNDKCVKAAQTDAKAMSASASASVPFAEVSAQVSAQSSSTQMNESGCGQFALNVQNQLNAMKNINCKIKSTSNSVGAEQVSGNSINIKTLPLTPQEEANKAKLEKQLTDLQALALNLMANPRVPADRLDKLLALNKQNQETAQALLDSYNRDINLTNSSIVQSIVQRQASSISLSTADVDSIVQSQKAIAQATAENKLAQDLGVAALTPNSKSIINSNIEQSGVFTSQNVTNTVNSIKLTQTGTNTLELTAPGNINFTNSNISQSIVADMIVKALVGNSFTSGTQIANDFSASASATIASDGKSAGADALVKELGAANAAAIGAAKVSGFGGAMIAIIIVIFLAVGFGAVKSTNAVMKAAMNNAVFILAAVSIVVGIVFLAKSGAGNKIVGVILLVVGVAGLAFGAMLKRPQAQPAVPLGFRFQ